MGPGHFVGGVKGFSGLKLCTWKELRHSGSGQRESFRHSFFALVSRCFVVFHACFAVFHACFTTNLYSITITILAPHSRLPACARTATGESAWACVWNSVSR